MSGSPPASEDPYPHYRRLRESSPVLWDADRGRWLVTRYDDVAAMLVDPRLSSARSPSLADVDPSLRPLYERNSRKMIVNDAPVHTRLRGLVGKAFTPAALGDLDVTVRRIANGLLDAADRRPDLDLIRDFASPLPLLVIAAVLKIPMSDYVSFKQWCDDTTNFFIGSNPAFARQAKASMSAIDAYLAPVLADRRTRLGVDAISILLRARDEAGSLTEEEVLANVGLIINAGHETTRNLIGNGLFGLLRHPEQLRQVAADRSLLNVAVEEVLRFESPVQRIGRVAREDIHVDGSTIRRGDLVVLIAGSANRDAAAFDDADTLDIGQQRRRHVAFGLGPHFCLGAPMARLVGSIAFDVVLDRYPRLSLATEQLDWHSETLANRGLRTLPVRI